MYNIYIHEKKLSDFEKASNEKKKILKYEIKRKKEINNLTKNYNKRMKNFVLNLCENPVILGENYYNEKLSKTQSEFFINNNNYEKEKKNYFVFGDYMTDKKKVELINKEKLILQKFQEMNKKCQKKRDIINARKNNINVLLQPKMKFGPREEIENIVETMNKNGNYINNIKYNKILSDHLKNLKFNNIRYVKRYDILKKNYGDNYKDVKKILKDENLEDEFSHKNTIVSKFSNTSNIDNQNKKNKIMKYSGVINSSNSDSTIIKKIMSKENKSNLIKSNELKKLFNDNRKIYFNGASQYINLKKGNSKMKHNFKSSDVLEDNEISVIYTDKNIYFKKINNLNDINQQNNNNNHKFQRQISMPDIKNNEGNTKNILSPINQNKNSYLTYLKKYLNYSPKDNKSPLLEDKLFFSENPDNNQGLSEETKSKNLEMQSLINKEINQSIVKYYFDKYNIINEFNKKNTINTINLFFQGDHHINEKPDENLDEKLNYLTKIINKRNNELMKENNDYISSVGTFKLSNKKGKKKRRRLQGNDFILIDGQFILKKDIKSLSDIIFTKCNFYKEKKAISQKNILKNQDKFGKKFGLTVSNFYTKINT